MADSNPDKPFHFVTNLVKHPANLAVDPLAQNHAQTGRLHGENFLEARALTIERDAVEQLWSERRVPWAFQRYLVFFFDFVTRMGKALGEVAVVRQEEKAFGLRVEAADIEKAWQMPRQQIEDRVARIWVVPCRNKSGRLMQHDIEPALALDEFAVDLDVVALAWVDAKIGADLAVDRNATGGDEFIAMAARTEPGRSKKTIKAHGGRK